MRWDIILVPMSAVTHLILLVDDERWQLELTKAALEEYEDLRIITATSAAGALEVLSSRSVDAVISDYQIPGTTGIELLTELRSSGNNIPFILFTGRGREEVAITALNCGADFYVRKGMDSGPQFAELHNAIIQVIKRKEAETLVNEIFRNAPVLLMVMDEDRRIYAPNPSVLEYTKRSLNEILGMACGLAIQCVHSSEDGRGCGYSQSCGGCQIWASVRLSIENKETCRRVQTVMTTMMGGERSDRHLLVSTSPIRAYGRDLALVCLEDITDLRLEEP